MASGRPHVDLAGLLVLDRAECLGLLAAGGLGRIAISIGALPAILPVHYTLDDECVVLCVRHGGTVARATRDVVVAFEADGSTPGGPDEWSVAVTGMARHLGEDAHDTWAPAPAWSRWSKSPHCFVSVSTELLSGRRTLVAARVPDGPAVPTS